MFRKRCESTIAVAILYWYKETFWLQMQGYPQQSLHGWLVKDALLLVDPRWLAQLEPLLNCLWQIVRHHFRMFKSEIAASHLQLLQIFKHSTLCHLRKVFHRKVLCQWILQHLYHLVQNALLLQPV